MLVYQTEGMISFFVGHTPIDIVIYIVYNINYIPIYIYIYNVNILFPFTGLVHPFKILLQFPLDHHIDLAI